MNWLSNLFFGSGVAHCVLVLALAITAGVALGKVRIAGVSLGITWVLFVGLAFGHFGMDVEPGVLNFAKEFGLILFVYSIGLQVGPGFFSSFKKAGIKLNAVAMCVVFLGVATACFLSFAFGVPMSTMVGILSGAVTNTPGLGAASQAYLDMFAKEDPSISLGYAVAYPLGVIGAILSMTALKFLPGMFSAGGDSETKKRRGVREGANRISISLVNPSLFGKKIDDIVRLAGKYFVISRVCGPDGRIAIASPETVLERGDKILVVCDKKDTDFIAAFLGEKIEMEWQKLDTGLEARRIMITNHSVNGETLGKLGLFGGYSFNITRVNRAGIDLVAHSNLQLQVGDRVTVVGSSGAIGGVEKILGNSMMKLRQPNLVPIFLGIFLGVLIGSLPVSFPGIPQPVKLGLAGGPLIVSILLSRFGPHFKMVTYTTVSASLMLREVGIALFLASVGIGAGGDFVSTVVCGGGYKWIAYGFAITVLPLLFVGAGARLLLKTDYFTLIGVLAGSVTNPPALAYATSASGDDSPAVAYATVYPLTMFMRVLTAQLLIIFFVF